MDHQGGWTGLIPKIVNFIKGGIEKLLAENPASVAALQMVLSSLEAPSL
jgi:hypothetical protein